MLRCPTPEASGEPSAQLRRRTEGSKKEMIRKRSAAADHSRAVRLERCGRSVTAPALLEVRNLKRCRQGARRNAALNAGRVICLAELVEYLTGDLGGSRSPAQVLSRS